jgi:hypothetical protein
MTNKQANELLKEHLKDTKFKFQIVGSNDKPLVILKVPTDKKTGEPFVDAPVVQIIYDNAKEKLGENYNVAVNCLNVKIIKTKGNKNILSYSVPIDKEYGEPLFEERFVSAWVKDMKEKCPIDYILVHTFGKIEIVE